MSDNGIDEAPVYALTGVTKNYQKGRRTVAALKDVELQIHPGEWLAIQGRTGHGKSTLLQMLGGLDRPNSGSVLFHGEDLARIPERRLARIRARSIGFIFQTFNLVPTLTAEENVAAGLIPLRLRGRERRDRVAMALDSVGLSDRSSHLPSELSGGQQQRVAVARALAKEPDVLLADEPTGNLDEDTREEIMGLLEGLWRDRGLTLVVVTHDSAIARRAERVTAMVKGKLTIRRDRRGTPAGEPRPASG